MDNPPQIACWGDLLEVERESAFHRHTVANEEKSVVGVVKAICLGNQPAGMIRPAGFPELHFIMWDQRDTPVITPELAHALYRDRWGYVHECRMLPNEAALVDHLERRFGAIRKQRNWRRARGAWVPGKPISCRPSRPPSSAACTRY